MKFLPAEPNENLQIARWLSEEGKWELGYRQMMFGVRVSMSRVGGCCYTLDYCAADDQLFSIVLLHVVAKILEQYPEDVTPRQLQQDFPRYDVKPINKDPQCWVRLQEMAGLINPDEYPSIVCPQCGKRSYNSNDIQERYCGYCHQFHEFMEMEQELNEAGIQIEWR